MIYNTLRKPIFFLLLISSLTTMAQKATIGLRGGVNAGWHKVVQKSNYKRDYKYSAILLPSISIPIEIPVTEHFSIQPEVNFTVKGVKSELLNTRMILKEKVKVFYLDVPLLAKLSLRQNGKVTTGFFFGPGLGYGLSGRATSEYGPEGEAPAKSSNRVSFTEGMKRFEGTLNAGVNFIFDRPDGKFIIDIRYQHGISNNIRKPYFTVDPQVSQFSSRGVIMSLGFSTKGK